MAFFGNNAVNYLNLHYGIHCDRAQRRRRVLHGVSPQLRRVGAGGVRLAGARSCSGASSSVRSSSACRRDSGCGAMVAAGTLMSAVQYPLLAEVHGVGPALYWLIAMSALERHRLLADLPRLFRRARRRRASRPADRRARSDRGGGRRREPAGDGMAARHLRTARRVRRHRGRSWLLAALPFLRTPDVKVAPQSPGSLRAALPGALLFAADGWIAASYVFVWQIALFLSLARKSARLRRRARRGRAGRRGRRPAARTAHRPRLRQARGLVCLRPARRRRRAARARRRQRAVRRGGECARRARRLPLYADPDDGDVHPGQARALHACASTSSPKAAGTSAVPAGSSSRRCSARWACRCGSASCSALFGIAGMAAMLRRYYDGDVAANALGHAGRATPP